MISKGKSLHKKGLKLLHENVAQDIKSSRNMDFIWSRVPRDNFFSRGDIFKERGTVAFCA